MYLTHQHARTHTNTHTLTLLFLDCRVPLKTMHEMWNKGIPVQRIRPFQEMEGKYLRPGDAKYLSVAKTMVGLVNRHLPSAYGELTQAEKDAAFSDAFETLRERHFKVETLGKKRKGLPLCELAYVSLYSNYLKSPLATA